MSYIGNNPATPDFTKLPSFTIVAPTYSVLLADQNHLLLANAVGGTVTVNLPAYASVPLGFAFHVKKVDSSGNTVVIDPNGSETINGVTTKTLSAQWDGLSIVRINTGWVTFASSTAGVGGGGGGGSLSGLSDVSLSSPSSGDALVYNGTVWVNGEAGSAAVPGGSFDVGLNSRDSLVLSNNLLTNSYQYTGTGAAVVYGVIAANIDGTNDATVSMVIRDNSTSTDFIVAKEIPVPADSSLELLKRPKVLEPNDQLKFQANAGGDIDLAIRYTELNTNTDLFNAFYAAGAPAVSAYQAVYTESNTNGSLLESITLANSDGTNDVEVSLRINDGSTNPVLVYTMNVPAQTSIEVCEIPVVIKNGEVLQIQVSDAARMEVTVSGRVIP